MQNSTGANSSKTTRVLWSQEVQWQFL